MIEVLALARGTSQHSTMADKYAGMKKKPTSFAQRRLGNNKPNRFDSADFEMNKKKPGAGGAKAASGLGGAKKPLPEGLRAQMEGSGGVVLNNE